MFRLDVVTRPCCGPHCITFSVPYLMSARTGIFTRRETSSSPMGLSLSVLAWENYPGRGQMHGSYFFIPAAGDEWRAHAPGAWLAGSYTSPGRCMGYLKNDPGACGRRYHGSVSYIDGLSPHLPILSPLPSFSCLADDTLLVTRLFPSFSSVRVVCCASFL